MGARGRGGHAVRRAVRRAVPRVVPRAVPLSAAVVLLVLVLLVLVLVVVPLPGLSGAPAAAADRGWSWPLGGPRSVVRPFAPGPERWSAGHLGADLAGRDGQPVRAVGAGQVTYAGLLAGRGVVVVDHGGLRTTYEPLEVAVRVGARVGRGAVLGRLTAGHPCGRGTCLHLGLRRGGTYLDPLRLFGGPVRLLPRGAERRALALQAARCGRLVPCAAAPAGAPVGPHASGAAPGPAAAGSAGSTGAAPPPGSGATLVGARGPSSSPGGASGRALSDPDRRPSGAWSTGASSTAASGAPTGAASGAPSGARSAAPSTAERTAAAGLAVLGLLGGLALLVVRPRPPAGGAPAAAAPVPMAADGAAPPDEAGRDARSGAPAEAGPGAAPAPPPVLPGEAPLARVLALDDARRRRTCGC